MGKWLTTFNHIDRRENRGICRKGNMLLLASSMQCVDVQMKRKYDGWNHVWLYFLSECEKRCGANDLISLVRWILHECCRISQVSVALFWAVTWPLVELVLGLVIKILFPDLESIFLEDRSPLKKKARYTFMSNIELLLRNKDDKDS